MKKPLILIAEREFSKAAQKLLRNYGVVIDFNSKLKFFSSLPEAEILITGLELQIDKKRLDKASNLKLIASRTTQLRHIDLAEARRRKIKIINIKGNSKVLKQIPSTAEETMALLFSLVRKIPWAFDSIKGFKWEREKYGGNELQGKNLGIIGFGRLGRKVSHYGKAFGLKIMAYDPFVTNKVMRHFGVTKVDLNRLLKMADIVSLHSVYSDDTRGMIQEKHFRIMKPTAVFINTARGEITNEKALLKALKNKWITGAALDTLAGEVPSGAHLRANPLVAYAKKSENLIIVPHLGGATKEATEKTQYYIAQLAIDYIRKKF